MFKVLVICFSLLVNVYADFKEGQKIFENKCSSCHGNFVEINVLKENFFEKNNKLLNLKAPTVNMLAYAIMESPKKVGDLDDIEMRQIEIEKFLKSYLETPDRFNSICDEHILHFYETKKSMKGQLSQEDYKNLSIFFMEYKQNLEKKVEDKKVSFSNDSEIIQKAKNENKKIMVYATSKTCSFCKRMEKDVLSLKEIEDEINKDYIFVKIDVDDSSLPFDLVKVYKKVTPTFFIVSQNGKFEKQYPGAWVKNDFLEILKENKNK